MLLDVLARQARDRADHAFLLHEGRRVSFREFDRLANRAANRLVALGVVPGDRVTLGLGNSIEYVAAAFGILKAGGVLHPINPALGRAETEFILAHAAPRVVVRAETLGDLGLDGGDDTGPSRRPSPGDPSLLLYTSGTTGSPKGVLFTHGTSGSAGQRFVEALRIGADDMILAVTPLFHGNAWGAVQTALYAGGTVVFPTAFSASGFWPLVHETGTTVLYTLGTILAMLLSRPASDAERTHRMRVILGLGSAPVRTQVMERFGVRDVVECFGSTDAGVVTISPLGETPRPGSCGRPLPGVELRVLDDAGIPQPPRTIGEIAVRSPSRMTCYFKDPEATAEAVRDDWFLTGDLGWLDEDGWLYFTDRKRDVIRRGGENVSSVLVEKTLREHPAVAEVAVIGVPDPVLGQELKAYVVASGPVTAEELQAFATERLARFQVPRLWEFRDALPKTPTQRVEKYKLREEHASGKPLLG